MSFACLKSSQRRLLNSECATMTPEHFMSPPPWHSTTVRSVGLLRLHSRPTDPCTRIASFPRKAFANRASVSRCSQRPPDVLGSVFERRRRRYAVLIAFDINSFNSASCCGFTQLHRKPINRIYFAIDSITRCACWLAFAFNVSSWINDSACG